MSLRVGRARISSSSAVEPGSREQADGGGGGAGGLLQKNRYRIVMMGAAGVGKTCIINRFLFRQFVNEYKATVDEMYTEEYLINGIAVTLDFLDTSGSHEFPAMRKLSIDTADAFILVYSIDDEASFEEIKQLRNQILDQKNSDLVPIVIVGNKSDCRERQVQREMAESTVNIDWGNGFVEASAKDNVNVSGIFRELLHQAKVQVSHSHSMLRRWDSAPVFSELPAPPNSQHSKPKLTKRNSCRVS
jgi:RASD family protein 2